MPGTQNLAEAHFQDELTIPQQKISISWTAHSQPPRCTGGQTGWLSMEAIGRRGGHPEASLRRGLSSPWPWEMSTESVSTEFPKKHTTVGTSKSRGWLPFSFFPGNAMRFLNSWPTVLMQHRAETFERDFTEYWINYLPKYQVFDLQITTQLHKLL